MSRIPPSRTKPVSAIVSAAYQMWQSGIPADVACAAVGIDIVVPKQMQRTDSTPARQRCTYCDSWNHRDRLCCSQCGGAF